MSLVGVYDSQGYIFVLRYLLLSRIKPRSLKSRTLRVRSWVPDIMPSGPWLGPCLCLAGWGT